MFQNVKVATNETSTLHWTISTRMVVENYNNNDQKFNRQGSVMRGKVEVSYRKVYIQ